MENDCTLGHSRSSTAPPIDYQQWSKGGDDEIDTYDDDDDNSDDDHHYHNMISQVENIYLSIYYTKLYIDVRGHTY